MENILRQISQKAIQYEDLFFQRKTIINNWLGNDPATEGEILAAEKRLGITLPNDYKNFLMITNGYIAPNDAEPSFEKIETIDYLENIDFSTIEAFAFDIPELENSILIAGIKEEQYFLLIPPDENSKDWKYWKFANWIPGQEEFKNLEIYFESVLNFQIEEYEK